MKIKICKWLMAVSLLLGGEAARSQEAAFKFDIHYTVGVPMGNFKNVTDEVSPRGFEAAFLYGISDQLSIGLATGFQDFYQKYPRVVLHQPGEDLSAVITNSVQTLPIMAKAKYRFTPNGKVQPYAALAAGANFLQYNKYYGAFVDSRSKIGFAAQPELGLNLPVSRDVGVQVAGGYNYMPFQYNDADGLHHLVLKAGVNVRLR